MDTESSELYFDPLEDLSEEFFRIVARSVEFGNFAPDDTALRDRVIRLTARGRLAEAVSLVARSSGLGEEEARELIKQVESAAGRVFYATGLRPPIRPKAGEEIDSWGVGQSETKLGRILHAHDARSCGSGYVRPRA